LKTIIHKPLTKLILGGANHIVTLSKSELSTLKSILPKSNSDFILENAYSSVISQKKISKPDAKKHFGLPDKPVILFFGAIRKYKGLEDLIEAFALISNNGFDGKLVIAGAFWEPVEKYSEMIKSLGIEKNVLIIDKYVSDSELPQLFSAADVLVLPHRTATQSAIPQLAFIYQTPMIITGVGGNSIFVDDKKTGLMVPPQNPKALASAISEFFGKKLSEKFVKGMKEKAKIFEWNEKKEAKFFGEAF
jgi:glycosyltransferase involved in cell wall biosynthesis